MLEEYRRRDPQSVHDLRVFGLSTRLDLLALPGWLPDRLLDVSSLTIKLDPKYVQHFHQHAGFADRLRSELGRRVDNLTTFRLVAVTSEPFNLQLSFELGKYVDYLNSCETLTWELALAARRLLGRNFSPDFVPGEVLDGMASKLPRRQRLDPFAFMNRSAAAGISTLTILAHSDHRRDVMLLHRRGTVQAEGSGTLHVVPAGMFQPLNQANSFPFEFSIRRNVLREFGEEVLGKEQLILERGSLDPDQPFIEDRDLAALKELFETGGVDLRFLGLGLDPVTLKPELLTLLVVNDDLRTQRGIHYRANWEGEFEPVAFSAENIANKMTRRPNAA